MCWGFFFEAVFLVGVLICVVGGFVFAIGSFPPIDGGNPIIKLTPKLLGICIFIALFTIVCGSISRHYETLNLC